MMLAFDAKQKLKLSVTRNKKYLSKYLLEEERVVGAMLDPNKLVPEGAGRYNNIGGVVEADLSSYTVTNGVLVGANADGGNIAWTSANATKLNSASYRDGIRKYNYKTKNPSYNVDNWTNRYGHSFRMNAVEDTNKNNIKCLSHCFLTLGKSGNATHA